MKTTKILSLIAFLLCFSAIATAVEYSIPNNEIHYTSIDGNIVTPYKTNGFGANIVSNTYENGQGVITFDEPVTSIGDNAFRSCYSLTSIAISESVTTIGNSAFQQCISLTSIIIGNSVTGIDNSAFRNCISLVSITIPNKITSIRSSTFNGCSSLTSITIPNSVTSIEDYAFYGCSSLSSITLQNNVTNIGIQAFYACSSLISITIPEGVTSIRNSTFCGCSSLTSISIPESVTTIENYAFSDCTSLTSITIPNSVTSIGNEAFESCTSLTSITLPNSVISIGDAALRYCTSLTSISIPSSVTSIGKNAFHRCKSLSSITIPNSVTSIGNDAFNGCVFVGHDNFINYSSLNAEENKYWGAAFADKEINGLLIIYDNIMACRSYVTSITIPNSITSIGRNAFYNCSSLTSITIPNGVTSIGDLAFHGCSSLSSITIPNSIKSIGDGIFSGCYNLSSIVVESGNTTYDSRNNCNAIIYSSTGILVAGCKNTIIPDDVTTIENKAFQGCSSLTSITIPNSVTSIGGFAFDGCSSLTSITIPNSVTSIGGYAFYGCSSLTSITIPDSVTSIKFFAFCLCSSLTSVIIPNGVTSIEDYAFEGCSSLTSITIPDSVTIIGSAAFASCSSLTSISIGNCVTKIGSSAFGGCSSLTSITIPNSVINVEQHAFGGCSSLTSITIGSGVTSIGYRAFYNHLDTINCHAIIPPSLYNSEVFYNYDAALYVPCEALEAYKADAIWGKFSNIQCITSPSDPCEDIVEIDWHAGIRLSQLTTGWYKFNIADIHANRSDITSLIINDLVCPTRVTRAYYANCEDEEPLFEGSATYELGATQQAMTYADFANIVPAHVDYLYLNIASIVEDCEPTPPCEDVATEEYATICYGETYTWNGQSYSTTGEYTQTLSSVAGCDSIVTLYLTILPETVIVEESVTINEEYLPYTWRNQQCYSAGTYNESIPFANYPYCDSVIYVLNLTVEAPNKCGDHLYWHYSNNTMTITGSGAMYDDPDLLSYRTQDWYPVRVNNIVLPDAITHIGNVAFADCANLTNIDIPSSVTSIGDGAFSWTGLLSVTLPASVTELGEQVFETCNNLHTILYEGTPSSISNQTIHPFIGCVHLDTIITPAELWHCTSADPVLENRYGVPHKARYIEVTDGFLTDQAIKYIANNNASVQILDLTNATNTTLPYGAWSNSYQLSTLYLPQQIEVIPESMVEGARNLSEIAIPATVMEIGNYAFAGCVNVWRMTVDAVIPPKVYENTFDGISRSISVQVPAGSEDLYREAAYWREFFIEHTNTPSPISNCQKLLRKDQILILRNGKVYTTMGQLINTEE